RIERRGRPGLLTDIRRLARLGKILYQNPKQAFTKGARSYLVSQGFQGKVLKKTVKDIRSVYDSILKNPQAAQEMGVEPFSAWHQLAILENQQYQAYSEIIRESGVEHILRDSKVRTRKALGLSKGKALPPEIANIFKQTTDALIGEGGLLLNAESVTQLPQLNDYLRAMDKRLRKVENSHKFSRENIQKLRSERTKLYEQITWLKTTRANMPERFNEIIIQNREALRIKLEAKDVPQKKIKRILRKYENGLKQNINRNTLYMLDQTTTTSEVTQNNRARKLIKKRFKEIRTGFFSEMRTRFETLGQRFAREGTRNRGGNGGALPGPGEGTPPPPSETVPPTRALTHEAAPVEAAPEGRIRFSLAGLVPPEFTMERITRISLCLNEVPVGTIDGLDHLQAAHIEEIVLREGVDPRVLGELTITENAVIEAASEGRTVLAIDAEGNIEAMTPEQANIHRPNQAPVAEAPAPAEAEPLAPESEPGIEVTNDIIVRETMNAENILAERNIRTGEINNAFRNLTIPEIEWFGSRLAKSGVSSFHADPNLEFEIADLEPILEEIERTGSSETNQSKRVIVYRDSNNMLRVQQFQLDNTISLQETIIDGQATYRFRDTISGEPIDEFILREGELQWRGGNRSYHELEGLYGRETAERIFNVQRVLGSPLMPLEYFGQGSCELSEVELASRSNIAPDIEILAREIEATLNKKAEYFSDPVELEKASRSVAQKLDPNKFVEYLKSPRGYELLSDPIKGPKLMGIIQEAEQLYQRGNPTAHECAGLLLGMGAVLGLEVAAEIFGIDGGFERFTFVLGLAHSVNWSYVKLADKTLLQTLSKFSSSTKIIVGRGTPLGERWVTFKNLGI
ncbi:MAG: hypothetical protein KJ732_03165, partial [Candidatus Margulisbacteria bacterium]|nr:hypothetical protein [Candidatus Margulisiibacteriota bacterium]